MRMKMPLNELNLELRVSSLDLKALNYFKNNVTLLSIMAVMFSAFSLISVKKHRRRIHKHRGLAVTYGRHAIDTKVTRPSEPRR